MRVLLDESLPRPLAKHIGGHYVRTVSQMKWTRLGNGALLNQAATAFDVLLTADKNIEFQQNLTTLPIAVVVLVADRNRLESLEPLVPAVLQALATISPKTFVRVGANVWRFSREGAREGCVSWPMIDAPSPAASAG